MGISWSVLSESELERVDGEALGLLERVGLEVLNPELRKLLSRHGARVE